MRLNRLNITIFVIIAAFLWGGALLFLGIPVTWEYVRPFTFVVGVLVVLGLSWEHILWHQAFFHGWLIKRPDIRGTWRIELQSSYIDRQTNERVPMILCYMGIKQTLTTLQMHLMTPESESWVIASHICPSPNGKGYQVFGIYRNKPNIHARERRISEIHHGAFILDTHGSDVHPNVLRSEYWTDRKTAGTMNFTNRIKQVHTCYEDAHQACSAKD